MNLINENPLGYEKISKLLKSFAFPSITATLVSSLYNIVDQIFIGQGVGYLGNAATNVSYPLSTICLAISLLIGIGSSSRFSICLGRKDANQAAKIVGNGIILMIFMGILYLALGELFLTPLLNIFGSTHEVLPYARQYASIILLGMPFLILTNGICSLIRADGSPRYSMLCMASGAIVNTILDPVFIFAFHWGIFGAALATILGQVLSFIMAVRYIPLAACGIVMKTNAILLSIIVGISQGVQPIIGYNFGARKYDRVKQAYSLAIQWNLVVSVIGFILFQFFPRPIISLFGSGEPLYFEFAVFFMRTFLFMAAINGVQLLSSNFFTAVGKAMKGLLLSLTRQVFFLIPLILVLPLRFGIFGVLLAGPVADFAAFVVSAVLVHKEFRRLEQA